MAGGPAPSIGTHDRSLVSKYRRRTASSSSTPDGFGVGDEAYSTFARGVSRPEVLGEYNDRRQVFDSEIRQERRERSVRSRELQEYRDLALKSGNLQKFSNWLACWTPLSEENTMSEKVELEEDDRDDGRQGTTAVDVSELGPEDTHDFRDTLADSSSPTSRVNRRQTVSVDKRAERSWARKAVQSALMESSARHVEWFH